MAKGEGTPQNPGTLSKFHVHSDGTRGWDTYTPDGEKVHITGTEITKDDPRNTSILTTSSPNFLTEARETSLVGNSDRLGQE